MKKVLYISIISFLTLGLIGCRNEEVGYNNTTPYYLINVYTVDETSTIDRFPLINTITNPKHLEQIKSIFSRSRVFDTRRETCLPEGYIGIHILEIFDENNEMVHTAFLHRCKENQTMVGFNSVAFHRGNRDEGIEGYFLTLLIYQEDIETLKNIIEK